MGLGIRERPRRETMTESSRVWFSEYPAASCPSLVEILTSVFPVTGTSKGLGRALLEEVLSRGERAVATLRRPEVLAALVEQWPSSQLLVLQLDVSEREAIAQAFRAAEAHFGRIDVVVNNAGYAVEGEIEATPEEVARAQMEVGFWGPVYVMIEVGYIAFVNCESAGLSGGVGNPLLQGCEPTGAGRPSAQHVVGVWVFERSRAVLLLCSEVW